jgi:hypothetical protein
VVLPMFWKKSSRKLVSFFFNPSKHKYWCCPFDDGIHASKATNHRVFITPSSWIVVVEYLLFSC